MASQRADPVAAEKAAAEVEAAAEALVGIWSHVAESLDVRISPTQLRALTAVGRYGELNLSQLAEALGALPSSASRLCDRLEAGRPAHPRQRPGKPACRQPTPDVRR